MMIYPFQWQYILIPLLPKMYTELLDAPVPYITGLIAKKEEKCQVVQNYESALVVLLDSGELHQNENEDLKKLPYLNNLRAKIEIPYKKIFPPNGKKEICYCPTTEKLEAVNQICTVVENTINEIFISKLSCNKLEVKLNNDLEKLKAKFVGTLIDREFNEKFVESQLFATFIEDYYNH